MWIYKLTNTVNGKIYVGRTVNLRKRLQDHKAARSHYKSALHAAIRSHGWNVFTVEVLERGITEARTLATREVHWIAELRACEREVGYNLTPGGEAVAGPIRSERHKANIAASARARFADPAQREQTARALRGRSKPTAHKEKLRHAALHGPAARVVEYGGEALNVTVWAHRIGVSKELLKWRLDRQWPIAQALGFEQRSKP